MTLTRREFGKVGVTAGIGVASLGLAGCPASSTVFTDIMAYTPVALQAIQAVLAILAANGVKVSPTVGEDVTEAKVTFADLQAAVATYESAQPADKTTALQKVSTLLAVAQGSIQKFWTDLNLPDNQYAAIIAGVLGIVLSTMAAFMSKLPPPTGVKAANYKALPFTAQKRTPKQMRDDINKALAGTNVHI